MRMIPLAVVPLSGPQRAGQRSPWDVGLAGAGPFTELTSSDVWELRKPTHKPFSSTSSLSTMAFPDRRYRKSLYSHPNAAEHPVG